MDRRNFLSGAAMGTVAGLSSFQTEGKAREPNAPAGSAHHQLGAGPLWTWSAVQLSEAIRRRQISARQATESCLQRLREVNPAVNAVVEVLEAQALTAADAADQLRRRGDTGRLPPLFGVPMTTKINVDVAGHATTNGVVAFQKAIATEDSSSTANLRKGGAIIIGRTNTPAFSFRWFTDNDLHGRTLNPWDPSVTPGGSSGGAASAVAVGIGPIAHGNDIAGSVRYPAYCCGVSGIRPSLGRVPGFNPSAAQTLRGITGQLMGVQGLLSRSVADLRLALPVLAARDVRDSWWTPANERFAPLPKNARVALVTRLEGVDADPSVAEGLRVAASALTRAGYVVEEIVPPRFKEAADIWSPFVLSETGQNLKSAADKLGDVRIQNALKTWLDVTTLLDLQGFSQTLGKRDQIRREWRVFMQTYPIVITPASWRTPFPIDYDQQGPEAFREILKAQSPSFVVPFLGLPGLTVPTGVVAGLPTAVQVVADWFREDVCFDVGEIIEAAARMPTPINPRSARSA